MKPVFEYEGRSFRTEAEMKSRVAEIHAEHEGEEITGAAKDEWNAINERLEHFQKRRDRVAELARDSRNVESGDGADFRHSFMEQADDAALPPHVRASRDAGLRAIERHQHALSGE